MKKFAVLTLALAITGCASQEMRVKSAEYGGNPVNVATRYGDFSVYEHPSRKRLAVSATLADTLKQGAVRGLTFGAVSVQPSEGAYQEAAEAYIAQTRRLRSCRVRNGYLLQAPVYEFILSC
ncbi:hypothetical protein [Oryzicola mucosus]|uniref:Lipoprotein n=1 Tax=Oryzicola mucosus TaxID=2767425 RepID=A0A8J6U3V1_9HYPH|nr:hypothetical protein [Oryzicola mucosus]MBD0413290.1 hypothetical protein [Oryzicola mucosus]